MIRGARFRALAHHSGMTIADDITSLGGVAATHELLMLGWSSRSLSRGVASEQIIRVRQGWYCLPETTTPLLEAFRVGGKVGCVSAAAEHGMWVTHHGHLHVDVARNSARLRTRFDKDVRLRPGADQTIVHWLTPTADDTRFATSPLGCLRDMIRCQTPERVVAAADSAIRMRLVSREQWLRLIRDAPERLRALLHQVDPRSESITESLVRFRLQRLGLEPRIQVTISGIGRVDILIGSRLVIEIDGRAYHSDPEQFEADRRRDARLSARGYRVLRFSFRQVMSSWTEVKASVLAAVARGDHLP